MVIATTANVGMSGQWLSDFLGRACPVETRLQNGTDGGVGQRIDDKRPLAGGVEAIMLVAPGKGKNAERRTVSLFGMWFVADDPFNEDTCVDADLAGIPDQACRIHPGMPLMGFGHMLLHRDVPVALGTTAMRCDPLVVKEYFDHLMCEAHGNLLPISWCGTE